MISSALLVINPASRHGARARPAAERVFREMGVSLEIAETAHRGHAVDIVRQHGLAYDAVFVLGGDGTVMEAVTALAGGDRPVGVLPCGTGNLIAGALGVPKNIARAVRALVRGNAVRVDLARFQGGRYFAFAAGLGIDASMLAGTTPAKKRRWGVGAYIVSASRAALARDEFDLIAEVDGAEFRARASLAMVANFGSLFGGLFRIGPAISVNDGTLDLCVYSPKSTMDVLSIVWRVWRKDFRPHPRMRFVKGRRIRITSDPLRVVEADGELVGVTPIEIDVAPDAASFLVPRR